MGAARLRHPGHGLRGAQPRHPSTARARDALLAEAIAVPARVVAVTRDVYTDGESDEIINHAPVVTFTTLEGTEVTVLSRDGIPDPSRSLGRRLTIHYAPSDPAVCTPDLRGGGVDDHIDQPWVLPVAGPRSPSPGRKRCPRALPADVKGGARSRWPP
ncbi:hypothetical protein [Streptomyces canus]|uniref:hypothetical protein n=1 Tax=Streptomyces canus TaxID=58343 RepID=UPI0038055CDA